MNQSDRMEGELEVMRGLFRSISQADELDPAKMVSISRVILQQEKEIARQRLAEGKTLDRAAVEAFRDQLVEAMTGVARSVLEPDQYNRFIDALVPALLAVGK